MTNPPGPAAAGIDLTGLTPAQAYHLGAFTADLVQAAVTRATIRTVVLTLRQLATWCVDGRSEMTDDEFRALAVQVDQIEPGWTCPMCQEVTCDGGCPLEAVRDFDSAALRQLVVDGEAVVTEPDRWVLTCYGDPDGEFDTLDQAITASDDHIRRTCPHGPTPWAATIVWHRTTLPELHGAYVSSAGGSWLNHRLEPLPTFKITPAGPSHSPDGSDVSVAPPRVG